MKKRATRRVVFQPTAHRKFQRGINQMVDVVRPTLGPHPRIVANEQVLRSNVPELLDNAGVIARRVIALPDRDEDMGAMYVRHLLWRLHEQVGDGTATAAVLFQTIYNQGLRYLAAGGNAMRLRHHLEQGLRIILDHLDSLTMPLEGKEQLARFAESSCDDPPLAKMLGEIFDIIGEHGQFDIRNGRGRDLDREYVDGMYWPSSVFSRSMLTDQVKQETHLENSAILIGDLALEDPRELVPILEMVAQSGIQALVLIASSLSEQVTTFLIRNHRPPDFQVIAVKTPGFGPEEQGAAVVDLAILTGGRPLLKAAGNTLGRVTLADLGRARRAWASTDWFGIAGGKGDPRTLRTLIGKLREAHRNADDPKVREKHQRRIGKLLGGAATLLVGGDTKLEIDARKDLAERTARSLRGALLHGVVPGGGVALLACRAPIRQRFERSDDIDERTAGQILVQALAAPARAIIRNAGYDAEILGAIDQSPLGYGFDARSGQLVDMARAGILDATSVLKAAVHASVSGAALALTIDVLVHRRKPEESIEP
jgi:chaperonin GroEL